MAKVEAQYDEIRTEKASVEANFPSTEDTKLTTKFAELVGDRLQKCKEIGLSYLQAEGGTEDTTS